MEKSEKVHFFVPIVFLIQYCVKSKPIWNSRGQGHLMIFAKDQMSVVCQHFQRASFRKLLGQFHLDDM